MKINRLIFFMISIIFLFILLSDLSYSLEGFAYAKAKPYPGEITIQTIRIGDTIVYENENMLMEEYNITSENTTILVIIKNNGESDLRNLKIEYSYGEGINILDTLPKEVEILKKDESVIFKSILQMNKGSIAQLKITAKSEEREKSTIIKLNRNIETPSNPFTRYNILITMAVILAIILILTIYALWPRMKPDPRLISYIRKCRHLNISDEEIAQSLYKERWKRKLVEKHLKITK